MASENIVGDMSPSEKFNKKELVVSQVKGKVKWFNVDLGYGFINREDINEDVFVHHTAIAKYNTRHQLSSLADDENVEFDVVRGPKGLEASNVTGPNGEQVKGSRFASNLYAGRFRFRRGRNYGGGNGGRRFYSRRPHQDRPIKDGNADDEAKGGDDSKREKQVDASNKEPIRTKKYPRSRGGKFLGGPTVRGDYELGGRDGGLKRSSSLPSDLNQYSSGNTQNGRRRRRGPPRPFFRGYNAMKRGGQRTSRTSDKEYSLDKDGNKVEDTEPRGDNSKSVEGELKGSRKEMPLGQRKPSEGKSSEKSDKTATEKSEKSQRTTEDGKSEKSKESQGRKQFRRKGYRTKKNSEPTGGKVEHSEVQEGAQEDKRQANEDNGDGSKDKGQPQSARRGGRWRRGQKGGRGGGRSSSVEASTTPSTRGEGSKSEPDLPGGNGDGANVDTASTAVAVVPITESVAGEA